MDVAMDGLNLALHRPKTLSIKSGLRWVRIGISVEDIPGSPETNDTESDTYIVESEKRSYAESFKQRGLHEPLPRLQPRHGLTLGAIVCHEARPVIDALYAVERELSSPVAVQAIDVIRLETP